MRITHFLSLLLFAGLLFFTSCQKEQFSIDDTTIDRNDPDVVRANPFIMGMVEGRNGGTAAASGIQLDCITIDFPFELLVDSVVVAINDLDDLDSLFLSLDPNNPPSIIDFNYPIDITFEDGTMGTADDAQELSDAILTCPPTTYVHGYPAYCITQYDCIQDLVYPVELYDIDSNLFTANDSAEFVDLLAMNDILFFAFPLDIIDQMGNVITMNSEDDLFMYLANCHPTGGGPGDTIFISPFGDCLEFIYPVGLLNLNGQVDNFDNETDLFNAIISGFYEDFDYPFEVIVQDSINLTINDAVDFDNALMMCDGGGTGGGNSQIEAFLFVGVALDTTFTCYDLSYPFVINEFNGNSLTINDESEAWIFMSGANPGGLVQTPVEIIRSSDSTTVTLNDGEEYFDFLTNNCY
jgi:hypothetical protein